MNVNKLRDEKVVINVTTQAELAELEEIFRENGQLRKCNHECNGNFQIEEIQSRWEMYRENLCFYFYECLGRYIRWGYSPKDHYIDEGYRIISLQELKTQYC
jgi:hypothetical protein